MTVAGHAEQSLPTKRPQRDPATQVPSLGPRRAGGVRLEHAVMVAGVVALAILVVFPLGTLLVSSIWGGQPDPGQLQGSGRGPSLRQGAVELADPRRLDRPVQRR